MKALARYLANLTTGRTILWCYLIWYLVVLVRYFDPSPRIWLTSLGLAAIIGTALYISTTAHGNRLRPWQIARLFMMPFFVSSFSALVKGRGFTLVFSPNPKEILLALGLCAVFCVCVRVLKRSYKASPPEP
jgi:peptidoglycan/LPS O-acetylase OafA/YrhL